MIKNSSTLIRCLLMSVVLTLCSGTAFGAGNAEEAVDQALAQSGSDDAAAAKVLGVREKANHYEVKILKGGKVRIYRINKD